MFALVLWDSAVILSVCLLGVLVGYMNADYCSCPYFRTLSAPSPGKEGFLKIPCNPSGPLIDCADVDTIEKELRQGWIKRVNAITITMFPLLFYCNSPSVLSHNNCIFYIGHYIDLLVLAS